MDPWSTLPSFTPAFDTMKKLELIEQALEYFGPLNVGQVIARVAVRGVTLEPKEAANLLETGVAMKRFRRATGFDVATYKI